MASLKQLKMRIASVKSTQKITKAMKMVASAKLRRAQAAAEAARPFAERADKVIASLASRIEIGPETPKLLAGTGKDQVHLLVVATSERGLCGAFNTNIVRLARRKAQELTAQGKTVKLLLIGKKGRAQFLRTHREAILDTFDMTHFRRVNLESALPIAEDIARRFEAGEFDVAHLFFARFRSALVQEPTELQIVPVPVTRTTEESPLVYEYEPDEETILAELLPRYLLTQVLRALLENAASEEGSRMTAMDNATRNAGDMINRLTITYNRTRQAAITKELIEIISGAEAL